MYEKHLTREGKQHSTHFHLMEDASKKFVLPASFHKHSLILLYSLEMDDYELEVTKLFRSQPFISPAQINGQLPLFNVEVLGPIVLNSNSVAGKFLFYYPFL